MDSCLFYCTFILFYCTCADSFSLLQNVCLVLQAVLAMWKYSVLLILYVYMIVYENMISFRLPPIYRWMVWWSMDWTKTTVVESQNNVIDLHLSQKSCTGSRWRTMRWSCTWLMVGRDRTKIELPRTEDRRICIHWPEWITISTVGSVWRLDTLNRSSPAVAHTKPVKT